MFSRLSPHVVWGLGGIVLILLIATIIVQLMRQRRPQKDYTELVNRVNSWWMMVAVFLAAILLHRTVSLVFFAFVSFLALKEYLSLIPTRRADRRVLFWAYLTIPVQYYWVSQAWYGMFIIFIPVYMFLYLPFRMLLIGQTQDFLRAVSTLHWGVMTMVFCISHVAFLLVLPEEVNPAAGSAGLVLYLVFLTQFNDVSQYVWGKSFGKSRIVPSVSPGKTWAGFVGGVLTTTLLAFVLGRWFTPMSDIESIGAGVLIAIAGFIGDINMSALKRDLGVKDSGSLLPGHGGILDRIDSLTFTAPLFFHYLYWLHY
jgi:phosphatidate cytidylyltransferase